MRQYIFAILACAVLSVLGLSFSGQSQTLNPAQILNNIYGKITNCMSGTNSFRVIIAGGTNETTGSVTWENTAGVTVTRGTITNAGTFTNTANTLVWGVQNESIQPGWYLMGTNTVSSSVHDDTLRACSTANDGTGGKKENGVWKGVVGVTGTGIFNYYQISK